MPHPMQRFFTRAVVPLLPVALILGLTACGPSDKPAGNLANPEAQPAEPAGQTTAPPAASIAARPINLRSLALPEGATITGKTGTHLSYTVKADSKSAYDFPKKQFAALGWKELPDASVTAQSASGNFTGAGYKISVTVYPFGGPGLVTVMLHNHGNFDFAKLPVPAGTKPLYVAGPITVLFLAPGSVAETIDATRKAFLAAGWEPHGGEEGACYYKQGLNRVLAAIQAAPAQGGKTVISYTGELMSGDQPAPPDAQDVGYVAPREELTFKTAADKSALTAFYKTKLGATGWKQDDEKTYRIDDYDQIPYRAPDGDVMFLKVWPERGGTRNVTLEFISKEAIADMDKESKERKVAGKDKKPATPLPAPEPEPSVLPKIVVPVPAEATNVEKEDQRLKFRVAKGRGQAVAEGYQRQFKAAGWKEESATFKPTNGTCAYSKDGDTKASQRVFINYSDFGNAPAEIKFSSFGARLEQAAEKK